MDKKLKQQLKDIIKGNRPRPLMYCGYHNGKKCYVRKQDLTYWQLKEKYPPLRKIDILPKPRHVFQRQHHLKPIHLREAFWGYVMAGCAASFCLLIVITYVYVIVKICI